MFVTCGNCDAEYELDEAKIPAGGARLRCTSCDQSFVVTPPEASDIRSADDLAHDSLTAEARRAADSEPDRGEAPDEAFEFDEEVDSDHEFEVAIDEGFDLDTEAAAESEIEAASDEGLDLESEAAAGSELEAASDDGFDLNAEADPEPESDEGIDLDTEAAAESDFEAASDDGFDLNAEAESGAEVEAASEENFDPDAEADWQFNEEVDSTEPEEAAGEPESAFDEGDNWSDLSKAEDVVDDLLGSGDPIEADAAAAVDDLLGEIDTVDSHVEESDGKSTPESDRPSQQLDLGDASLSDRFGESPAADAGDAFADLSDWEMFDQPGENDGSATSAGPSSRSASAARTEPQVGIAIEMVGDSPKTVRWTDRVSAIAGWGAVCALVIVALVGGFATNSSDARATSGSWSGAGFEADQIVGRWVENAVAGSIYVVSGRVRRAAGADRAARKTLAIRLIDTKGREIDRAPIPLAPAVPARVLREFSPAELDDFQLERAGRIAVVGERWVSFEAVLTELPRFAGRFELQAIDR